MNIEKIIRRKRGLEYAINKNNDEEAKKLLEQLLKEYYNNLEVCHHHLYLDYGYYKIINDQVEKSDKENADFRVVKCNYCGKNYLLPKRDNLYWDAVIENHAITVLPKAKQKAKNQYITRQQMYKQ